MLGYADGVFQMRVFQKAPHRSRKVVVATNIAEASITISGIVYSTPTGLFPCSSHCGTLSLLPLPVCPSVSPLCTVVVVVVVCVCVCVCEFV